MTMNEIDNNLNQKQGKHEYEVDSIIKQEHFFTYIVELHGINTTQMKIKTTLLLLV